MASVTSGKPAEECRRLLGEERHAALSAEVEALPESVDRGDVFGAIVFGERVRRVFAAVDPAWCRRRDDALEDLERSLETWKSVLIDAPWLEEAPDGAGELAASLLEELAGGLERELGRIRRSRALVMADRGSLGFSSAPTGRPKALWRHIAKDTLRALNVTDEAAEALLRAASITGADAP